MRATRCSIIVTTKWNSFVKFSWQRICSSFWFYYCFSFRKTGTRNPGRWEKDVWCWMLVNTANDHTFRSNLSFYACLPQSHRCLYLVVFCLIPSPHFPCHFIVFIAGVYEYNFSEFRTCNVVYANVAYFRTPNYNCNKFYFLGAWEWSTRITGS